MHPILQEAQDIAQKHGGKLLSTVYNGLMAKYKFSCRKEHIFETRIDSIRDKRTRKGVWCKECSYDDRRISMDAVIALIIFRDGQCLTDLSNIQSNLRKIHVKIKCLICQYLWTVTVRSLLDGNWCKSCSHSKHRKIMTRQQILNFLELFKDKNDVKQEQNENIKAMPEDIVLHGEDEDYKQDELKDVDLDGNKPDCAQESDHECCIDEEKERVFSKEELDEINKLNEEIKKLNAKKISTKKQYFIKTYNEALKIAKNKGGSILSPIEQFNNITKRLVCKCADDHFFYRKPQELKKDEWCPICDGNDVKESKTINPEERYKKLKEIVEKNGGKLLCKFYPGVNVFTPIKCEKKHVWLAKPWLIERRDTWCPNCNTLNHNFNGVNASGEQRSKNEKKLYELLTEKGFKCLTEEYINCTLNMLFECPVKHKFIKTPIDLIRNGITCSKCNTNVSEEICRRYFEYLFEKTFNKARPTWLINESGNQMELDGYNEELGIAFEYNGAQHYQFMKLFHKSEEDLERRKKDDLKKWIYVLQMESRLIIIPHTVPHKEIQNHIIQECLKVGHNIRAEKQKYVDYATLNIVSINSGLLEEVKKMAENFGGKCLSDTYINHKSKLEFECKREHKFKKEKSDWLVEDGA